MDTQKFVIKSLDDLPKTAENIVRLFNIQAQMKEYNCIAFYGEMGAGKTTLIKEICKVLGVKDITSSPTFALINEYLTQTDERIFHFDFYRINNLEEAYDLGYEDYFYSNNLCMIEWPEKIESLLPEKYIEIKIDVDETNKRLVQISYISE
ncbi:MAG: tRNA (adenosine(37)-N6)-threonylcarbamoyltransferase complex ATPase subunit type 1 TsaE [Bacteroidales bacterium]|nr:tRNA (adenosine(37)-N6)-threonylcarbamoyltransferase complex ATPase subunit type 1 TsaE [Bacteroidales bacterium]